MKKEDTTKKWFLITKILIIFSYCCEIYSVMYSKQQIKIVNYDLTYVDLVLAWIPLLLLVIICLFYSCGMTSNKYEKARPLIYMSVSLFALSVIFLFTPSEYLRGFSNWCQGLLLVVIGSVHVFLHGKIEKLLIEKKFSFTNEFYMIELVEQEMRRNPQYKWSKILDKMSWLFITPFIIQSKPKEFAILTVIIALSMLYPMVKNIKSYLELSKGMQLCSINPRVMLLNFVISIMAGIIMYSICLFEIPAFILLYSSMLTKHIIDNKLATCIRSKIERMYT